MPPALRRIEGGRRAANTPAADSAADASSPGGEPVAVPAGASAAGSPDEDPPRVDLIRARIASDYYGQAHVRERILSALLEFLDE